MKLYKATIRPLTAFSSAIQGDTLFGYMCWEYLNEFGSDRLNTLLADYAHTPPFVVSDAIVSGYLPKPNIPLSLMSDIADIKQIKKLKYIPISIILKRLNEWSADFIPDIGTVQLSRTYNSINRQTATTTGDGFDPYTNKLIQYRDNVTLEIFICINDDVISADIVLSLLTTIGNMGYGKAKTRGLGKFDTLSFDPFHFESNPNSNAYLTLASHYPQQDTFTSNSYYKTHTKFGKHGDIGALGRNPHKSPIIMCSAGAVMTPTKMDNRNYIGVGLGGNGQLSAIIPKTVHQAYSPVVPIYHTMTEQTEQD